MTNCDSGGGGKCVSGPGGGMRHLRELIRRLRAEDGCAWDREQTLESMAKYLTDEAAEAVEEIGADRAEGVCEELGDVLLVVVMMTQIAEEEGRFDFEDVVRGICEKIVRRHPHVFGDVKVTSTQDIVDNWRRIKEMERRTKRRGK